MATKGNATTIQLLTAFLAETATRADNYERERDAAKKEAASWYDSYMTMKKRAEELEKRNRMFEDELAAEIAKNKTLCEALENAAATKCPADCPGKKGEA